MPLFVAPSGVEIEMSAEAASRVGYKPKQDAAVKPGRKPRQVQVEK